MAIGTSGHAPVLARRLRERIEAILPARIGELAALMGRYRRRVVAAKPALSPRLFWQKVVDGPIGAPCWPDARRAGRSRAGVGDRERRACRPQAARGTVCTRGRRARRSRPAHLRALQVLQDADIVFYDELVTDAMLDRARRDAERVFVGKRRGEGGIGQDEINRRLVEAAQAGLRVVRLKGGDRLRVRTRRRGARSSAQARHSGGRGSRHHRCARLRRRGRACRSPSATKPRGCHW